MDYVILGNAVALIAVSASIFAAGCAYYSYRLSKSIYDEIKNDEVIIVGRLHHPGLTAKEHGNCVIRCGVFNKPPRKAYISGVKALDQNLDQFNVTWSSSISEVGEILKPTGLLGIKDSIEIYIRRNDGV